MYKLFTPFFSMIRFATAGYVFQSFVNAAIWHDKCNANKKICHGMNYFEKNIQWNFGQANCYTWSKQLIVRGYHEDFIKWNHFPRYWPFVLGIHRSPVNSPRKGQWRGALMFALISAWINGWINNREAGDLRRHRTYYDVTVMQHWIYSFAQSVCNFIGR